MVFRTGLAEKRKGALEKELERIIPLLINLGAKKVILFGSLSVGRVHRSSDIDLVVIRESNERFLDRLDEFYREIRPNYGVDFFIYTPEEFEEMKEESPFLSRVLRGGRILYEA